MSGALVSSISKHPPLPTTRTQAAEEPEVGPPDTRSAGSGLLGFQPPGQRGLNLGLLFL